MNAYHLPYQFLEAALFWDTSASFWVFLLIINRESHGVVFVLTNKKRLLNLNNILTLPKVSSSQKLGLIRHNLCLTCLLPARFTCMHASLWKRMQAVYRNYHINLQWLNTGKKSCERMSFLVTWQKWYSSTGIFLGILSL